MKPVTASELAWWFIILISKCPAKNIERTEKSLKAANKAGFW